MNATKTGLASGKLINGIGEGDYFTAIIRPLNSDPCPWCLGTKFQQINGRDVFCDRCQELGEVGK